MRILFADDHTLVRDGIRPFLCELDKDVDIVEADDLGQAKARAVEAGDLDLILLDLKMPGMNGFTGVRDFAESHPGVPIVILSGHYNRKDVIAALDHGVAISDDVSIGEITTIAGEACAVAKDGKRVLVVDDSESVRKLMSVKLNAKGIHADFAEDGVLWIEDVEC